MMLRVLPLQKKFNRTFEVPGSKSYTNRALLIAALADGKSVLYKPLLSDDTIFMMKALRKLGIKIAKKKDCLEIIGKGGVFKKLAGRNAEIYLGNAGTAVRFLTAALSLTPGTFTITGNERMQERPIQDLIDALIQLGADIKAIRKNGCPPLLVGGGLKGGKVTIRASDSSQFLSAILMTAPYTQNTVNIFVKSHLTSLPYITMTLDIMKKFGVSVENINYKKFIVQPQKYKNQKYFIEPDASSATYPFALAALHNSTITVPHLGSNSKQADMAFLKVLKKMGCKVQLNEKKVQLCGPLKLKPLGKINVNHLPDAAMTIAVLAAFAKGRSVLTGLGNLRLKETDRLHALANELAKVGVKVKEGKDYLEINGDPDRLHGACIETYDDHRMAMCFAVLGTKISGITIMSPECVSKTYPTFWKDIKKLGLVTKRVVSKKNLIILSGMRGSGKSSLGSLLAQKLNYHFIDTDIEIEKEVKKTIPEIVAEKGWPYFRKLEASFCKNMSTLKNTVIATGGGIMLDPQNQRNLKRNGLVVFLFCEVDELEKRLQKDYKRPSLTQQKTLQNELMQLWSERKSIYYNTADVVFETSHSKNIETKSEELARIVRNTDHFKLS